MPPERLVNIASFRDLPIAEIAKSKIESEGIPCFLINKYHIALNWTLSQALGGVKVQVAERDVERALEILNDTLDDGTPIEFEDIEPDESELCDKCGSSDIAQIQRPRRLLTIVLSLVLGLPCVRFKTTYQCRACGMVSD